MKRLSHLLVCIIIGILLGAPIAHAQPVSEFRDQMMLATIALEEKDYPRAIRHIKAAHFADRSRVEPFELLQQIPPPSQTKLTSEFYYDLGTEFYVQQDYHNARFYYAAAHQLGKWGKVGRKKMASKRRPRQRPRPAPEREPIPGGLSVETGPVYVKGQLRERVPAKRYAVEHSSEVDAILKKYEDPALRQREERRQKIAAAKDTLPRSMDQFTQIVKSQKLKQQQSENTKSEANIFTEYQRKLDLLDKQDQPSVPPSSDTSAMRISKKTAETAIRTKEGVSAPKKEPRPARAEQQVIEVAETIRLDEELWARQPGTVLEIEFGTSVILEGKRVKRFFVFDPNVSSAERRAEDEVTVTMLRRGTTIFHLWDERGRWTFNLKGVLPISTAANLQQQENALEQHAAPFRVSYSNNWNSFYLGDSPDRLDRMNLSFTQWVGIYGDTPYGSVDAAANFYRFADSTENTGRTVGLSNDQLGPFEDFSIRGWDASKRFSELSLPGRYFRGALFDSYALDRRVQVSLLKGQDRATFLQNSQGVTESRKSYIEGARLVLFPEETLQVAFNYARGYGEERPKFLKDKIFSAEVKNRIGAVDAQLEVAYDEENFGTLFLTEYRNGDATLRVNLRDLEDGFTTITSRPSGSGEVGGHIIFDYRPEEYQLSTNLDVYRDREIKNPNDPDNVNVDFGAVFSKPFGDGLALSNSFFASHTPQIISPRTSLRLNTTLSKAFRAFNERYISTFVTGSAQMSRYDESPSSEYDRYGVGAGIRFPIIDRLNFYVNYTQSFVEVKESGERNQPRAMNTGLSYSHNFGSRVSGRASVTYRDEEETDGRFSFLSGTDTIRGSVGLSYRPVSGVEIFLDGNMRNVLTENVNQAAFHDADVRIGMRADWDTFFRWDPVATVRGTVYKDLNRNSIQDPGEPGVEGIIVRLGKQSVTTSRQGTYRGTVRAKKVKVGLDFNSIPQGFSLSSYLTKDIDVRQGKTYVIDFGFITRSGIYGVFFEDANGNGDYDIGEQSVANARIILDGKEVGAADFEGVYQFFDVTPGEHTLMIDMNALPLEYLPKIKLKTKIDVQEGRTFTFHVPLKRRAD